MPHKFIPEPWHAFFAEIDKSLDEEMSLHCLGGFVMTILYGLDRPTADVDVLPTGSNSAMNLLIRFAGEGSRLHNRHKVYLQVVGVAAVPLNYAERMTEMFPGTFKHLRLFALDPYDLALSKLERNTQRDRDDVKHLARTVPFDPRRLARTLSIRIATGLRQSQREDLTLRLWTEAIEEEAQ